MPFPAIGVTFDSAEACVGDCCDPSSLCPPRLDELSLAPSDLDISITCSAMCQSDCFADVPAETIPCWPDTGTLINEITTYAWQASGLLCDTSSLRFLCDGGVMGFSHSSSSCVPILIPTVLTFVQNSPFMVVYTMSSHWFGFCGWDSGLGDCTAEYEVTVTITEP